MSLQVIQIKVNMLISFAKKRNSKCIKMSSSSSTKLQTSFIHNKVDHFNKVFK